MISKDTLERANYIAVIITCIVAVVSLLIGGWQFYRTETLTRQTLQLQHDSYINERDVKAIDLILHFEEIEERVASQKEPAAANQWRHNALIDMTEAVFRLTNGVKEWKDSVDWMLDAQMPFLTKGGLACTTWDPDFVVHAQEEI